MLNSCLYEGRVVHRRLHPVAHDFTYKMFMLYLDLSELDEVFRGRWLWSTRRPSVAWFRRSEHLGDRDQPLDEAIRQLILERTGSHHDGPIRMLTHLRNFGLQMNPVSFFYCFDKKERLTQIVAEVNNTPWGEQHCYVLGAEHFSQDHDGARETIKKDFHVSPFMPMDMQYRWRVSSPSEQLIVGITNFQEDRCMLDVAMSMERAPITAANLRRVLVRYPLMTARVFSGIYWQAFRLWRKKVQFFPHPNKSTITDAVLSSNETNHKDSPDQGSLPSETQPHNV